MGILKECLSELREFRWPLLLKGIAAGLLTGLAVTVFRALVLGAEHIRHAAASSGVFPYVLLVTVCACIIICVCLRLDDSCSGSGVPRVKGELAGQTVSTWYSSLLTMITGTACSVGAGMSVGQVGPAAQIGAMTAKGFSGFFRTGEEHERLLMISGSGAGFSAVLNAPFSGVMFSLEEMKRGFSLNVFLTSVCACFSSYLVIHHLFAFAPLFTVSVPDTLSPAHLPSVLLLGLAAGLLGVLYNLSVKWLQSAYAHIRHMPLRIAVPAVSAVLLTVICPDVLGGGGSLINSLLPGHPAVRTVLILLAVKYLFTVICFSSGTPGGLIGPVLVMGAMTGFSFACLAGHAAEAESFMLLGMGGYFSGITQLPLTATILICEISDSTSILPQTAIVCFVSFLTARLLRGRPIFQQLLGNTLSRE